MAKSRRLIRYVPAAVAVLFVGIIAFLVIFQIRSWLLDESSKPKKSVQQVTLVQPPPPPPPPPEVEQPPEPEMEEEVNIPEPEQSVPDMADAPPPGDLGLDAEGGAGGDAFGLAARKGGRGLLDSGRFGWYGHQMQNDIHEALNKIDALREESYSVELALWIAPDGSIRQVKVEKSTGISNVDQRITDALKSKILSQAPPEDMPQPVKLRITSKL